MESRPRLYIHEFPHLDLERRLRTDRVGTLERFHELAMQVLDLYTPRPRELGVVRGDSICMYPSWIEGPLHESGLCCPESGPRILHGFLQRLMRNGTAHLMVFDRDSRNTISSLPGYRVTIHNDVPEARW